MSWMLSSCDNLQQVCGVTYLRYPEISMLTWPMELLQWVREAVGCPDWSLPKFRETEMEMSSTLRSKVPYKLLGGRNEKQGVYNQSPPERGASTSRPKCVSQAPLNSCVP